MNIARFLKKAVAVTALSVFALANLALAEPYEYRFTYRNDDDSGYLEYSLPTKDVNTYAVFGARYGANNPVFYYLGSGLAASTISSSPLKYELRVENVPWDQVQGLPDVMTDVTTLKASMLQISNNLLNTSTSLNASTTYAGFMSYADKVKLNGLSAPAALSFTNNASRTIQTVAAAANGVQLSSTRNAMVHYSVTTSSTVQIGVVTNVNGYVVLEIAATNSATAGDWQEIGRSGNGQNVGLSIALSSIQTTPQQLSGMIPAGYYSRLRSVNANGTPTYTYNSGQEVLL